MTGNKMQCQLEIRKGSAYNSHCLNLNVFSTQKAAIQITEMIGSSNSASFSQGASLAPCEPEFRERGEKRICLHGGKI